MRAYYFHAITLKHISDSVAPFHTVRIECEEWVEVTNVHIYYNDACMYKFT